MTSDSFPTGPDPAFLMSAVPTVVAAVDQLWQLWDNTGLISSEVGASPDGHIWPEHAHDQHELIWDASGTCVITAHGHAWPLRRGMGIFVPAQTPHTLHSGPETSFMATWISSRISTGHLLDVAGVRPVVVPVPRAAAELLHLLHHGDCPLAPTVRVRAEQLAIDLLQPGTAETISVAIPQDERAAAVAHRLLADPADRRNLAQWGELIGASERTLARSFHRDTGMAFGEWRTRIRIGCAMNLLEEGRSVADTAHRVGYRSASAFSVAFRQMTGETPTAYATRARGGPHPSDSSAPPR